MKSVCFLDYPIENFQDRFCFSWYYFIPVYDNLVLTGTESITVELLHEMIIQKDLFDLGKIFEGNRFYLVYINFFIISLLLFLQFDELIKRKILDCI